MDVYKAAKFFRGPPLAEIYIRPAITRPPRNPELMVWRAFYLLMAALILMGLLT